MSKSRRSKTEAAECVVGFGYVGLWPDDGFLGWGLPSYVIAGSPSTERRGLSEPSAGAGLYEGEQVVLCKITIERVRDRRGRSIARRTKGMMPKR